MKTVRRVIGAALFLSVATWLGGFARAADSAGASDLTVLKAIPEDAFAVVVVAHLDKADEQIGKLTQEMQIPAPPVLQMLKARAGVQEGLDEHGSAAMAVLPSDDGGAAPPVAFVPVSDYKKFIGQLQPEDASAEITKVSVSGENCLAGKKEGFVVFADTSHKDLLKKILDSSRPIGPVIGSLAGWAAEHEVTFVATPTGVKKGIAAARKGIQQLKGMLANGGAPNLKMASSGLDIYDSLFKSAEKEVSQFGVAVRVDNDGGLHLDTRTTFVAGGTWAAGARGLQRPEGMRLSCMPAGSFMVAFDGAMPKSFSKSFLNMSVDMLNTMSKDSGGKELTEEQIKKLNEVMEKAMAGVRSMSIVMGAPKAGGSIYGNMVGAIKVDNAKEYMANYQRAIESMRDLVKQNGIDFPFPQEIKKVKIDDADGLELTMDMSKFFAKMPNNPATKPMMQMLFGPEGKLNVYVAPIDDTTVGLSYVNPENIARVKAACKNPSTSLAVDADIAQTAKLLPAGAQWVGYLSPKGFVDFISAMMMGFAGGPGGAAPMIPAFPQTPPIGFGGEVSPKGFDFQIVVPGGALQGVGTYVKQMQHMMAPGGQPQIR
jgi:hypothetical protein